MPIPLFLKLIFSQSHRHETPGPISLFPELPVGIPGPFSPLSEEAVVEASVSGAVVGAAVWLSVGFGTGASDGAVLSGEAVVAAVVGAAGVVAAVVSGAAVVGCIGFPAGVEVVFDSVPSRW